MKMKNASKAIAALLIVILFAGISKGQSNPTAYNSWPTDFTFTTWSSSASAGTYPSNMIFHTITDPSASLNPLSPGTGDWSCSYNLSSRNRFLGQGSSGISIIATSSAQFNNCSSGTASSSNFVGDAVAAFNTTGKSGIKVTWTGGTITPGDGNGTASDPRVFVLRLQYRVGTSGNFIDVPGPVQYTSSTNAGNSQVVGPTTLPAACENVSVLQLRWTYFQTGAGSGGTRPEMRLDDITVSATPSIVKSGTLSALTTTYGIASSTTSFNLSATNITAATGVTVAAPSGFELSTSSTFASNMGTSINVGATGTIVSTTVYIRLAATTALGNYSGNIICSSTGAISVSVGTVSSSVSAKALTMSGLSVPASKVYDGNTSAVVSATPALQSTEAAGTGTANDGKPITGDAVSITGTATGAYNSKDVATASSVSYSGLSLIGAKASNYTLTIQSASSATITKKGVTVTANNQSKCSGQTLTFAGTEFSTNPSSLFGSDAVTSVALTSSGAASSGTVAGSPYSIIPSTASGSGLPNYSFTYSNGTLTVNANNWIGGNGNWNTSGNWSCGVVPNSSVVDVTISSGNPVLNVNVVVQNLTLATGTTLSIGNNTLTVNSAISGSGTLSGSSNSSLTLAGVAGILNFTNGKDTLQNLTLNTSASATLGSTLNIASWKVGAPGTLIVGSEATLTTADKLTLKSNDSSTAIVAVIPVNGSGAALGTISGNVTVERDVHSSVNIPTTAENGTGNTVTNNALRAWRLLTAPVKSTASPTIQSAWQNNGTAYNAGIASTKGIGTLITGASATNGIDYASSPSLYSWDPSTNSGVFSIMTNTLGNISNGNYGGSNDGNTGYFIFIRGDRNPVTIGNPGFGGLPIASTILNPKGALITGRQVYNVKASLGTGAGQSRFTLIGNPYASPVDLSALTTNNVRQQYYIWNPNLNSVGGFVTIDLTSGVLISTPNTGHETQYLQSGQAFFAVGLSGSDGTITFDENNKANANNNYVFRPANGATESFRSNLYLLNDDGSTVLADGNLVQYDNKFSAGIDYLDVVKFSNINESIALLRNNVRLAIERRPLITSNDTLFFSILKTTQRDYQLQFSPTSFNHPGLVGYVKDSYKSDSTQLNLDSTTTVNFSVNTDTASQSTNRFMIVFSLPQGGVVPVTFTNIKAWQQNNKIAVQWNVANELNIKEYAIEKSIDGKTFVQAGIVQASGTNALQYNWIDALPNEGDNYYRIKSIANSGAAIYTQVVKVKTGLAKPGIAIYPNPVKDGIVGLQFTNMPKGLYQIRLINAAGQQMINKSFNHTGGSSMQTIPLGSGKPNAMYRLLVTDPNGTVTSMNVLYQNK